MKKLLLTVLLSGAFIGFASAQTLTKANNTTALNQAGSWVENTAPSPGDTLLFNSTWTPGAVSMGGSFAVNGLQITNVASSSGVITNTTVHSLTIGSGGVDMSSAAGNFRVGPGIILSANQDWSIASGRVLTLSGTGVTGNFTATVSGLGTLDFWGQANYGSQLLVNTSVLRVNRTGADIEFTNNSNSFGQLNVAEGTARFSSIGDIGVNSAAGSGTSTATLGSSATTNGTITYTGTTASSNRSFQVDRRSAASGFLVSTAGETLTISGNITHDGGVDAGAQNNAFRVGGDGNLTLSGIVSDNVNASFATSLAKEGSGILTLSNANTFAGGVSVTAGGLLVENTTGSGTGTGAVAVASGARVGGNGTISGNLTLAEGAQFMLSLTSTLKVTGTVTLDNTFSVASLVNLGGSAINWSDVANGTYTLINNGSDFSNIQNFGIANAENIGGKQIYFQNGSLQLVVIPEPSTWALIALGGTALVVLRRRRSRS